MIENTNILFSKEKIIHKTQIIRGENVMFDSDLAEIYNVETRVLKQD